MYGMKVQTHCSPECSVLVLTPCHLYMHSTHCHASNAGLQTGKTHAGNANMMMATAAAIMLLAAAVTYELPHLVS
jgi:uncharacterized paraquat-inducible protein A